MVVHGGVMHALHCHAAGGPFRGRVMNAAICSVAIDPGRRTWVVTSWNDVGYRETSASGEEAAAVGFGGGLDEG